MPQRATEPYVAVQGLGELGGVFAQGFLRLGLPVAPLLRGRVLPARLAQEPPVLTLSAVGERDLHAALGQLPRALLASTLLVQNDLSLAEVQEHAVGGVVVVWFEKKPGRLPRSIAPSLVWGHESGRVLEALGAVGLPAAPLASVEALADALALKNLYIQVSNFAGLRVGGSVGQLPAQHPTLLRELALEVLALEEARAGRPLDTQRLYAELLEKFAAEPSHQCLGRSAAWRLEQALGRAARWGLQLPTLQGLA